MSMSRDTEAVLRKLLTGLRWLALAGVLLGLAWIIHPPAAPVVAWPSAAQGAQTPAAELLSHIRARWAAQDVIAAHQATQVLLEAYPETDAAKTLAPALPRLEEAARLRRAQEKWSYQVLESPQWGRLAQAEIVDENTIDANPMASSSLIFINGSDKRALGAYLVPAIALEPGCQVAAGCVLSVRHPEGATRFRLRPLPDREGWWSFADPRQFMDLASRAAFLEIAVSPGAAAKVIRFEPSGFDRSKLALPDLRQSVSSK